MQLPVTILEDGLHTLQLPVVNKYSSHVTLTFMHNYVSFKILLYTYSASKIQLSVHCLQSDHKVPLLKLTSVFNIMENIPLCLYINWLISESP
jgi:hypothetical protein